MRKILIIEDDPVVGTMFQRYLERQGFTVELAKDGAYGLERLAAFAPDVVLLDMMLPKVSGIDVLRTIRAREELRDMLVLVLTNAAVPTLVQQAVEAGANRVFDKSQTTPFTIAELLHAWFGVNSPLAT